MYMPVESNKHTHKIRKRLKYQVFWARLANFGHLGITSDHINLYKSRNGVNDNMSHI